MQEANINSFWLKRAKKRLLNEYKQLSDNPPNDIIVSFREENLLEWHFLFIGLKGSPFEEGKYHGVLAFPENFPFSPPSIRFITPNGRFKVNERVCFALSDFHPECWKPAYTVSAILEGVYSFMMSETSETVGSLSMDGDGIRCLASKSKEFNGEDEIYKELFRDQNEIDFSEYTQVRTYAPLHKNFKKTDLLHEDCLSDSATYKPVKAKSMKETEVPQIPYNSSFADKQVLEDEKHNQGSRKSQDNTTKLHFDLNIPKLPLTSSNEDNSMEFPSTPSKKGNLGKYRNTSRYKPSNNYLGNCNSKPPLESETKSQSKPNVKSESKPDVKSLYKYNAKSQLSMDENEIMEQAMSKEFNRNDKAHDILVTKQSEKLDFEKTQFSNGEIAELSCVKKQDANTAESVKDNSSLIPQNHSITTDEALESNLNIPNNVSASTSVHKRNNAVENLYSRAFSTNLSSESQIQALCYAKDKVGKYNMNVSTNLFPFTPEHAPSTAKASTAIVGDSYPNKSRDSSTNKTENTTYTTLEHSAHESNLASDLFSERPKYQNIPAETGQQISTRAVTTSRTETPHITAARKQDLCSHDSGKNHDVTKQSAKLDERTQLSCREVTELSVAVKKQDEHIAHPTNRHLLEKPPLSRDMAAEGVLNYNPNRSTYRSSRTTEHTRNTDIEKRNVRGADFRKNYDLERLPLNQNTTEERTNIPNTRSTNISSSTTDHSPNTVIEEHDTATSVLTNDRYLEGRLGPPLSRVTAAEVIKHDIPIKSLNISSFEHSPSTMRYDSTKANLTSQLLANTSQHFAKTTVEKPVARTAEFKKDPALESLQNQDYGISKASESNAKGSTIVPEKKSGFTINTALERLETLKAESKKSCDSVRLLNNQNLTAERANIPNIFANKSSSTTEHSPNTATAKQNVIASDLGKDRSLENQNQSYHSFTADTSYSNKFERSPITVTGKYDAPRIAGVSIGNSSEGRFFNNSIHKLKPEVEKNLLNQTTSEGKFKGFASYNGVINCSKSLQNGYFSQKSSYFPAKPINSCHRSQNFPEVRDREFLSRKQFSSSAHIDKLKYSSPTSVRIVSPEHKEYEKKYYRPICIPPIHSPTFPTTLPQKHCNENRYRMPTINSLTSSTKNRSQNESNYKPTYESNCLASTTSTSAFPNEYEVPQTRSLPISSNYLNSSTVSRLFQTSKKRPIYRPPNGCSSSYLTSNYLQNSTYSDPFKEFYSPSSAKMPHLPITPYKAKSTINGDKCFIGYNTKDFPRDTSSNANFTSFGKQSRDTFDTINRSAPKTYNKNPTNQESNGSLDSSTQYCRDQILDIDEEIRNARIYFALLFSKNEKLINNLEINGFGSDSASAKY